MTTVEIGDVLEQYIQKQYPNLRITKGSGSVYADGDLAGKNFTVESKGTIGKSIAIGLKVWHKIIKEAQTQGKYPLLIEGFIDEDSKQVKDVMVRTSMDYFLSVLFPNKLFISNLIDVISIKLNDSHTNAETVEQITDIIWEEYEKMSL